MTIIGFSIFDNGRRAFVWADTEVYKNDAPIGHTLKLCTNPILSAVAVSTGPAWTTEFVAERLHCAVELKMLIADLESRLKDFFFPEEKVPRWLPDGATSVALVAWSHSARRLIGYVFSSSDRFTAHPKNSFLSPDDSDLEIFHLSSAEDLAPIAARQMATIRKTIPSAGAGMLVTADVSAHSITVRPTLDLASFAPLREPLQFAAKVA